MLGERERSEVGVEGMLEEQSEVDAENAEVEE